MHSKKVISNSLFAIMYKISILILGFLSRKIFIVYIGEELLGLNSMYSNLLQMLNLADLGLGVAVQYRLYEPIVKKDFSKIAAILYATKKMYNCIGVFILICGGGLSFFIQYFIKETTYPLSFIQGAFFISVVGVALGYFLSHKRLFFCANEDMSILNIVDMVTKLLTVITSLIAIIFFKSYYIYLLINVFNGLISNICINFIFDKRYPNIVAISGKTGQGVKEIAMDLREVIPIKIANYVYNSTDNIIISKVLGLITVAIYSNYMTIINAIMGIEYLIGNAFTASLGKLIKEERSIKELYNIYSTFQYLQYVFTSLCTVSLAVLCTPFVKLWVGDSFLLEQSCFALLLIDFFIHSMYQPASVFYGAAGKFKEDKWITLVSAVMNILISIGLVMVIGLPGVIIGTLITDMYIWAVRTMQVIVGYFGKNLSIYIIKMAQYVSLTIGGVGVSLWICSYVTASSLIYECLLKGIISCVVSTIINMVFTFKSKEFKYCIDYIVKRKHY